jgi:hypothetical protein
MQVHLPKPLHGWREFAGEVGVIVLGVLIAIALGQLVDAIHWDGQVADARALIGQDMARSNRSFAFRVAAHDCVAARLAALDRIVEQAAKHEARPLPDNVIPDIGNALPNSAWETSRASQTLAHFGREPLHLYGTYYLQLGNIYTFMGEEVRDWGVIEVLRGDPNRLGSTDIAGVRVAIKHASFENDIVASIAKDELITTRQLHEPVPQADRVRLAGVCSNFSTDHI